MQGHTKRHIMSQPLAEGVSTQLGQLAREVRESVGRWLGAGSGLEIRVETCTRAVYQKEALTRGSFSSRHFGHLQGRAREQPERSETSQSPYQSRT